MTAQSEPKELAELRDDLTRFIAKAEALAARAKDPYWATSAMTHLANFRFAMAKAFHDMPAAQKIDEGDLF